LQAEFPVAHILLFNTTVDFLRLTHKLALNLSLETSLLAPTELEANSESNNKLRLQQQASNLAPYQKLPPPLTTQQCFSCIMQENIMNFFKFPFELYLQKFHYLTSKTIAAV
jgi:hypothetical protein